MTLGGSVCIRNGEKLDFSWRESVNSLLPVCDVVVICDGESTDGTQEVIREWIEREPKLKLCVYPWPNPKGDPEFFVKWINYAREHVPADYQFQLDADEILDERSYRAVGEFMARADGRKTARITRLNFWRDHRHLIPHGHCCAHQVIRIAPVPTWLPSDGSTGHPLEGIPSWHAENCLDIRIFHYGFLRRRKSFFEKARAIQGYFFNSYDPRMVKAEDFSGNWMTMPNVSGWENALSDYSGTHPVAAKEWLKDRGYV